jgi:hypothetical protein
MAILRLHSERRGSAYALLMAMGAKAEELSGSFQVRQLFLRQQSDENQAARWLERRAEQCETEIDEMLAGHPDLVIAQCLDNMHVESHVQLQQADRSADGLKTTYITRILPPNQHRSKSFLFPRFVVTAPKDCTNPFYAATYPLLRKGQCASYHGPPLTAAFVEGLTFKGKHPITNENYFGNDLTGHEVVEFAVIGDLMQLLPDFVNISPYTAYKFSSVKIPFESNALAFIEVIIALTS